MTDFQRCWPAGADASGRRSPGRYFYHIPWSAGTGICPNEAASIGIIGGADGPTAIFLTAKLAPTLIGPIAVAAYSYMALVPVIQPPIMKLLTTRKERLIRMEEPREVSKREKMLFPIAAFLLCCFLAPAALPLLGMLCFGNLLKEAVVTERLAVAARNAIIDSVTILLGVTVGASTQGNVFLTSQSVGIFVLGALSFCVATASGLLFAKFMNLFLKAKSTHSWGLPVSPQSPIRQGWCRSWVRRKIPPIFFSCMPWHPTYPASSAPPWQPVFFGVSCHRQEANS